MFIFLSLLGFFTSHLKNLADFSSRQGFCLLVSTQIVSWKLILQLTRDL